jgi:hypothetical protein
MARPRVFISSTFYDLRQVREDLERFIRELGYEPVRNETGSIPYDKSEKLETAAYREVELCDIIVAIIGGRYGTESQDDPGFSISQAELRRALERGIQVFIFVERNVLSEFSTYQLNKTVKKTKYRFVDNVKVYEFVEQVHKLPRNNPIAPFSTSAEIVEYLRAQWSGLFQRFLQEQKRMSEIQILEEMNSTAKTLRELVTYLTEERANKDEAIQNILLASHPAFRRFAELTDTPYRVFFTNESELNTWLKARNWTRIDEERWDEGSYAEWSHTTKSGYLRLAVKLFDKEGRLKVFTENEWQPQWLELRQQQPIDEDEEVPF